MKGSSKDQHVILTEESSERYVTLPRSDVELLLSLHKTEKVNDCIPRFRDNVVLQKATASKFRLLRIKGKMELAILRDKHVPCL